MSAVPLVLLALLTACELQEVSIAEPEDVVVAEVLLRALEAQQTALLHRTFGGAGALVPGARVEVRAQDGTRLSYLPAPDSVCVASGDHGTAQFGSCYASTEGFESLLFVRPEQRYSLRIELPDGGLMTGETVVPGSFSIVSPRLSPCRLNPDTTLPLVWTRSAGAWAYVAETSLRGLDRALGDRGVELGVNPLHLIGLSVSSGDTTIVFPSEFGVFDRFDTDISDALVAIQGGLPPNVFADVVIAAVDRNYVNWVRGGRFNPSGQVRVPSVSGDGTGVFGSTVRGVLAITTAGPPPPIQHDCQR